MRQAVYIIYDEYNEVVARHMYENTYFADRLYYSKNKELTRDIIFNMANRSPSEHFYVVNLDREVLFPTFDFSYIPDEWDKKYIHMWNDDAAIRLFSRSAVLENPDSYTDNTLIKGAATLKMHTGMVYKDPDPFNIFFISYDEPNAEQHLSNLRLRYPNVHHIQGIDGILNAHIIAANIASREQSAMFYVVDADAEVLPTFEFNHKIPLEDKETVHVWHSHNPVNKLEYGYGGVKLFPTNLLRKYTGSPIDFTTSVSNKFKVVSEVSNITRFDTDPFSAWRGGFRECCKLASKIIHNQDNTETGHRLKTWCSIGDGEFGDFVVMGAKEGAEYGHLYKDQPDKLGLINDYKWLARRFDC